MQQTVIFLVRHGKTDFAYSPDESLDSLRVLTKEGISQIEAVGEYLNEFQPSAIYTSPLKRTTQTAEIIAEKCGGVPIFGEAKLYEVYDNNRYATLEESLTEYLTSLALKHSGEQITAVTHQDVILGALRGLVESKDEVSFEAEMAGVYRLVFVDEVFVEVIYLKPADGRE